MGFLGSSASFTRFKITDEVTRELLNEVPGLLKQYAFQDIDNLPEERSFGWVNFDDMLDTQWRESPPEKGHYFCFSLRLDTRRVPAGVMKKHVMVAIKEEEKRNHEQGRKFISRERKKELREQVRLRMMSRFLPIPAEFNVVWNLEKHLLYLGCTQGKVVDLFSEYFTKSFNLHLDPLTPYGLAVSQLSQQGEHGLAALDNLSPSSFS